VADASGAGLLRLQLNRKGRTMKKFYVGVRDGVKLDKGEFYIFADSEDQAEEIVAEWLKHIDATAYIDCVCEAC
jgi:hypothetical protein